MDRRFTLLLADSHTPERRRLAARLAKDGFTVLQATGRDDASHQLATALPDGLIVADLQPPTTAAALIAEIRSGGVTVEVRHVPIVVLAAEPRELALLQAFRAGADEFVARWIAYPELRARIGAVLSRAHAREAPPRRRTVGALVVDLDADAAFWNGEQLRLSSMEFALLAHLAGAPARVHSTAALLRYVWGYPLPPRTRTVANHVGRLRVKLAAVGADGVIVTRHGVGYQLVDIDAADAVEAREAAQG